jgi:hypothetical protein
MVVEGLAEAGDLVLAGYVQSATAALVRGGGSMSITIRSGEGIGGGTFSWTAAIALLLEAEGRF